MPELNRKNERLVGVFIVGIIVLNYPVLSLFSKVKLVFGIPLLYLFLFLVWAIFILCMALILERRERIPLIPPSSKKEKSG
jgi:uncharacterized membrane protein